ncbi:unnamed protein product [Rhizophagus irregularis]|nr:unnamed protein product [Rhizophagus irregularis]
MSVRKRGSGWDEKYIHSLLDFLEWRKIHWKISNNNGLGFYGLTKYPETKEFMMIIDFAYDGNLRSILSNDFNNITWQSKIEYLCLMLIDLETLHGLGYWHKDFHSGNILQADTICIPDFGLSGSANEQKSNALAICNGFRPEFGKGTPEFYKKLAYKCINANPNERPTSRELFDIFNFWHDSIKGTNTVIKEKKSKQHLKKLTKKY